MRCIQTVSLLLLPLLLVGLGSTFQLLEDGYPFMWTKAPDNLSHLPKMDSVMIINPWTYHQRMGLYRLLLSSTEPYMTSMGPNNTDNPLWALPLELSWMYQSGRLVDPSGASECTTEKGNPMCISPLSWWGCMSYFLSVIPFMAAMEKGIIGDGFTKVQVQIPDVAVEDYCVSHADCTLKHPELMAKWEAFFQALKDISKSDLLVAEKKDMILGYMGDALQASRYIEGLAKCQNKEVYYSQTEMTFAKGLIQCAEYLTATNFHSNLDNTMTIMARMPSRVLQNTDVAPYISDLSMEENRIIYVIGWTMNIFKLMGGTLMRMWTSLLCTQKERVMAQHGLINILTDPDIKPAGLFTVVTKILYSCSPALVDLSPFPAEVQLKHAEL